MELTPEVLNSNYGDTKQQIRYTDTEYAPERDAEDGHIIIRLPPFILFLRLSGGQIRRT